MLQPFVDFDELAIGRDGLWFASVSCCLCFNGRWYSPEVNVQGGVDSAVTNICVVVRVAKFLLILLCFWTSLAQMSSIVFSRATVKFSLVFLLLFSKSHGFLHESTLLQNCTLELFLEMLSPFLLCVQPGQDVNSCTFSAFICYCYCCCSSNLLRPTLPCKCGNPNCFCFYRTPPQHSPLWCRSVDWVGNTTRSSNQSQPCLMTMTVAM